MFLKRFSPSFVRFAYLLTRGWELHLLAVECCLDAFFLLLLISDLVFFLTLIHRQFVQLCFEPRQESRIAALAIHKTFIVLKEVLAC